MGVPPPYPWANRLSAHDYELDGRAVTRPSGPPLVRCEEHGLPIHGLLNASPRWRTTYRGARHVRARLDFDACPEPLAAFPFPHSLELEPSLSAHRLTVTTTVRATGKAAVPIAFGFHAYLRLPGVPRGVARRAAAAAPSPVRRARDPDRRRRAPARGALPALRAELRRRLDDRPPLRASRIRARAGSVARGAATTSRRLGPLRSCRRSRQTAAWRKMARGSRVWCDARSMRNETTAMNGTSDIDPPATNVFHVDAAVEGEVAHLAVLGDIDYATAGILADRARARLTSIGPRSSCWTYGTNSWRSSMTQQRHFVGSNTTEVRGGLAGCGGLRRSSNASTSSSLRVESERIWSARSGRFWCTSRRPCSPLPSHAHRDGGWPRAKVAPAAAAAAGRPGQRGAAHTLDRGALIG